MPFVLSILPVVFICLSVLAVGVWLVKKGKTNAVKYAGIVLVLVGGLPAVFSLLFFYYLVFHTQ